MAQRNTRRKNTYVRQRTARKSPSPFKWLLAGVVIGALIPGYFLLKSPSHAHKYAQAQVSEVVDEQTVALKEHPVIKKKKVKETSSHSNYDFYNLLSEDSADSKKAHNTDTIDEDEYTLKVSSFKTYEEADQLKAQLSLIGVEHINISKSAPYKVTIGPYTSKNAALKIKKELEANDLNAELISG